MAEFSATCEASDVPTDKCKPLSICTSKCHSDTVKQVALKLGYNVVSESESWDILWGDRPPSEEEAKKMLCKQKVNHFIGMSQIAHKDLLANNLIKFSSKFPFDYEFYKNTWCLPEEYGKLKTYSEAHKNVTYIVKPRASCGGRGIYLTRKITEIPRNDKKICQVYINKPLLIDKLKFDLRIYVLLTSCEPLSILVYNDGIMRFATCMYQEPSPDNISNLYMHLTNYAINKSSPKYVKEATVNTGSKRNFVYFNHWLSINHYDVNHIWTQVDDIIVKTIIAGIKPVQNYYKENFSRHYHHSACFELFGFDVMFDRNMKPFLLEVNRSPSLHISSQIDKDIKQKLIADTFNILYFGNNRKLTKQEMLDYEDGHIGNYRRVYPTSRAIWYDPILNHVSTNVDKDSQYATEGIDKLQSLTLSVVLPSSGKSTPPSSGKTTPSSSGKTTPVSSDSSSSSGSSVPSSEQCLPVLKEEESAKRREQEQKLAQVQERLRAISGKLKGVSINPEKK